MARRKVGNMTYHAGRVIQLEAPWRRIHDELEKRGLKPLQPKELAAVVWIGFSLEWGEIIGPTELNRRLGRAPSNHLGGRLSTIRIAVFEACGLVKRPTRWGNHRWAFPEPLPPSWRPLT